MPRRVFPQLTIVWRVIIYQSRLCKIFGKKLQENARLTERIQPFCIVCVPDHLFPLFCGFKSEMNEFASRRLASKHAETNDVVGLRSGQQTIA